MPAIRVQAEKVYFTIVRFTIHHFGCDHVEFQFGTEPYGAVDTSFLRTAERIPPAGTRGVQLPVGTTQCSVVNDGEEPYAGAVFVPWSTVLAEWDASIFRKTTNFS